MSKVSNQQLIETAVQRFPYPLKLSEIISKDIPSNSGDFKYLAVYEATLPQIFEERVVARVLMQFSRVNSKLSTTASISLYFDEISDENFIQYYTGEGHTGLYAPDKQVWQVIMTRD